jgi:hypothetical protein
MRYYRLRKFCASRNGLEFHTKAKLGNYRGLVGFLRFVARHGNSIFTSVESSIAHRLPIVPCPAPGPKKLAPDIFITDLLAAFIQSTPLTWPAMVVGQLRLRDPSFAPAWTAHSLKL